MIDCHTHIGAAEHFTEAFAADLRRAWGEVEWNGIDLDDHRAAVAGVERAVVLAFDAPACGFVVPDEYVAEYVAGDPQRLVGFASVDPARPDSLARLDRAVGELGLRGLKLGPIYQRFDPASVEAMRLFRRAEELRLPVLIHQATTFIQDGPLEWARPILLDAVARACPELRMCAAHLGHPWCDELMVVVRKHPHLYTDVSALHTRPVQLYFALRSAVEYRVTDRVLFGTDYPFSTVEQTLEALRTVNRVVDGTGLPPIPDEVIEGIVERDSLALLGVDEVRRP